MLKNAFVPDTQAAVAIDEFDDPTLIPTGLELLDQDAVQLQSTPLRVRRVTIRLDTAALMYYSGNQRARTHTSVRDGWLAYVTFGPNARGTVNGLAIRPGLMLAAEPATEVTFVVNAGWESLTFLVARQELGEHLKARRREAEFHMPHGIEMLQADPWRVRKLYGWGRRLVKIAEQKPEQFESHRQKLGTVRGELIEMLLATISGANDFEPLRRERTLQSQSRIVRKAEKFALGHIDDPVHVSDLCRACAVSERTLEYAFKEIMGLGPVAYLIRLRLHRVRQALLAAKPGSTTVSATALDWGFWHFGDFSNAYKDCFGETPSATLRKSPIGF